MIRFETVPTFFEFDAQLGVIINFAVESDHQLFVDGSHRLRSGRDIENRQASVPEKDSRTLFDPHPFPVRAAMGERIHHPLQNSALPLSHKSGYPAHR